MDILQAQHIFFRLAKFLGKAILSLFLLLLAVIALIHLPPVQKQITQNVSNYLTDKVHARVEIQSIRFSITGNVTIHDIQVWDPLENKIFSAQQIAVSSSLFDLLAGDLIFKEVSISGAEGHLIQGEDGLNIQYIIDAFQPSKKDTTSTSTAVTLHFKSVLIENILFEYTSVTNGITVSVDLGKFLCEGGEFSTKPNTIKAGQVILQQTIVNTLSTAGTNSTSDTVTSINNNFFSPDFGTGIIFQIKDLQLKNDEVSFHKNQVTETRKFDPSHLSLKNIQIDLADILMREDTLAATLQTLSAQLPGFTLSKASTGIHMDRHQLLLSGLQLVSGTNELKADLIAPYDLKSLKNADHDRIEINVQSRMDPHDFAYFLSDSLIHQFSSWGPTRFTLKGNYGSGKGEIKELNLTTGNSQLHAQALFSDVWDLKKISWTNLIVDASVGTDFNKLLTPFTRNFNIPPDLTLYIKSNGNPDNLAVDGKIASPWGNVTATGQIIQQEYKNLDFELTGEKVDLGKWLDISFIGPMDLNAEAKGRIGNNQHVEVNGLIQNMEMLHQPIHHIAFQSGIGPDTVLVTVSIEDPNYRSEMSSEILLNGPLTFTNQIKFDKFKLGELLQLDSTLNISGDTQSKVIVDQSSLEGFLAGRKIFFHKQFMEYTLDSMDVHALISPAKSHFSYEADYARVNLASNFDIREFPEVIQIWSKRALKAPVKRTDSLSARTLDFNMNLVNANFIKLLGVDVDDFSDLQVRGELNEQKQIAVLQASSGKFKGYGLSMDTLHAQLSAKHDSILVSMNINNLLYDSIRLGDLGFDLVTKGDTATSHLLLATDSMTLLNLQTKILPTDSGVYIFPAKLLAFDHDYFIDPKNPALVKDNNLIFHQFSVSQDDMLIHLDGDRNAFDVSLRNLDLTKLNFLVSPDSVIINNGHLSSHISYTHDQQLNLKANIDSLILYHSSPLTLAATAVSENDQVPFEFLLTNTSNKVDLKGQYFTSNAEVDASLMMDINNLELFTFLVSGVMDEMKGAIKGEAMISGPLQKPEFKGHLQFVDVGLTTVNPKLSFLIEDDRIELDNSGLLFQDFTLYDKEHHPLNVSGSITSRDYKSFEYDLNISSDQYTLINNPDSTSGMLRGLLVLDSDIKLKGNNKDTNIAAKLNIKNATDLTILSANDDIELLKSEGIIDFVDPAILLDSALLVPSIGFYDSLIASLPDFNLNSTVTIEDNASFRVLIDEQSGDYIEASGGANLELGYDRTGNIRLSGNYTIQKGVYRLSFYDLVKKNFNLVKGSAINWHGSPKNGDLTIKAVHTVKSNSIGLVGHEIGENEKAIYKRSLDYEVGINIIGTIDKPIISFSLDLPQNEKVNYPVLANKLDRLRQPEYESELNKQVFGLLVLGGFLPESSGADINSNLIATTALSNSVNSLLASQLNRFASQYIKGVNIDVGIQSFSDYSAPGGKTQTAMDFRVSKQILDDRLSFEVGGDFNLTQDQSGANTGNKNYRGDIAIIYDLTGNNDKQLKLFNNETYDIVYQEIRNTGISLIFIREFETRGKSKKNKKEK